MTIDNEKERITRELASALPNLSADQIAQTSPHLHRLTFPAGEIIVHQGDVANRFYILVNGRVEVWFKTEDNNDYQVAFFEAGEYFGETGLMTNAPRNATIRATEEGTVEVLALDRDDFCKMVKESQATEDDIAAEMVRRLLEHSQYSQ